MKLIIKGRKKFKVPQDLRSYIEDKILKYEKILPKEATVDVMMADVRGPQGGVDKIVHLTAVFPGEKNPFQIEQVTDDFFGSVDLAQERLEKHILKYKEKIKQGSRYPKKYWVAKKN
ncbi:MAG: hypothetical protein COS97_01795 [Candidatus Nealsonbacteria bacterium CG07_land_8_20_14_0_80_40_10]|nr:MAG: hypothetical protein COU44_02215 [Candidatus Nealsonbacteria bacterium CG10_big_fil_rev_8_21_14_0_10_40_24]PIU43284.1 MAG: hypothetical protein COS97_01795 [Candidatus Nealsonbacteria bacterium CG07_land_8_20_14_0_80_40_10]